MKQTFSILKEANQESKFEFDYSRQKAQQVSSFYVSASRGLTTNEVFPNRETVRPLALRKGPNISRFAEQSTGTSQRHFSARSFEQVQKWLEDKKFARIVHFVFDVLMDVLRQQMREGYDAKVVLEMAAMKKLLTYGEFQAFVQLLQIIERETVPEIQPV